jgi:hypothetical protein
VNLILHCRHPIIKKLHKLITSDPHLAELLANQVNVAACGNKKICLSESYQIGLDVKRNDVLCAPGISHLRLILS